MGQYYYMDRFLIEYILAILFDLLSWILIATFFDKLSKATCCSFISGRGSTNHGFSNNASFGIGCPALHSSIIHLDFLYICTFLANSSNVLIILSLRL